MDAPRPAAPSSRQSCSRQGLRETGGSCGRAASRPAPLTSLGAAGRSLSQSPGGSPSGGGGGTSAFGGFGALGASASRRGSAKHWLPTAPSAGALQLWPVGRRGSTGDLDAKASRTRRSLSEACRRYSIGAPPAGQVVQAARQDPRSSLQLPPRQDAAGLCLALAPGPPRAARGPGSGQLPRLGAGAELCARPAQGVSGSGGPAAAEEAPPQPGTGRQQLGDPGGGLGEGRGPAECAPSPPASVSGDTQVPEDEVQVPLAATLLEVYSSYADDEAEVHDRFLRLAFNRFAIDGASELARESLHDALLHMGFLTSTRERALDLSAQFSGFQNFDYVDFCEYANKFAALERAAVRQRADACLAAHGGTATVAGVQQFLHAAGVLLPYGRVERARRAAKLDHVRPEDMKRSDLLLTLAACKMEEGFAREDVAALREIFGELEQGQPASASGWGPLAKASDLVEGLLKFTGLYCVDFLERFADILPSDSPDQKGICFHEFLVWARRLRDAMMQDLWKCFKGFETSGSGVVRLDIAINIVEECGISLLTDAVDELLSGLGMQKDNTLDFHALVQLLSAARKTHGFSRTEEEELSTAFEKIDYDGTGELNHLQVLDLLRYLGHTISFEEANSLIRRVDFNGNGSMDRDEFLRLMRLMREQDIRCARKSFNALSSSTGQLPKGSIKDALSDARKSFNALSSSTGRSTMGAASDSLASAGKSLRELSSSMRRRPMGSVKDVRFSQKSVIVELPSSTGMVPTRSAKNARANARKSGRLPTGSVQDALAKLQLFPGSAMISELLQDAPEKMCFSAFMRLHDQCRFRMNLDFRRRGGFSEDAVQEIEELWKGGGSPKQFATVGELLWMFSSSLMVPVNTVEGRQKLLLRVQNAREAAIEAGVPEEEASRGGTADIGFYTFVHLVRGIVRDTEQEVHLRETEAASFAQFSIDEAAEFRRAFCDFAAADPSTRNQLAAGMGPCVDSLLERLTLVPAIPKRAMPLLLKSIGVKAPGSKLQELTRFLTENQSQGEADKNTLQFATFLRLLRWMLDTNFAGIGGPISSPRR